MWTPPPSGYLCRPPDPLVLNLLLLACAHHIPEPSVPLPALPPIPVATGLVVCRVDFAEGVLPKKMVVARGPT